MAGMQTATTSFHGYSDRSQRFPGSQFVQPLFRLLAGDTDAPFNPYLITLATGFPDVLSQGGYGFFTRGVGCEVGKPAVADARQAA